MSPEYAIALFTFSATLLGAVALVWAWWRRQLKTGDVEMYAAIADEEPDYADAQAVMPARQRAPWLIGLALAAILGLVIWMQVLTVRASERVFSAAHATPGTETRSGD